MCMYVHAGTGTFVIHFACFWNLFFNMSIMWL